MTGSQDDTELVRRAVDGELAALEELVVRHRAWIYNVALRMVWNAEDAEDVTQEVLLKAVTKLSTFEGRSSFRTWLHRLTCNHVLNMKRRAAEERFVSFSQFAADLDAAPDQELPDTRALPVDRGILVEEAKLRCLTAMLLGLDRRQRLAFVLSDLLGTATSAAAELMETSPENYRQILSRGRRALFGFMEGTCGLVETKNRCRCAKRTAGFIEAGHVDPNDVRFTRQEDPRLASVDTGTLEALESRVDRLHREQHRQTRFLEPTDPRGALVRFLADPVVRATLRLDG
ncbi:MAG: RNA polymerase sigma factor [Planctomycetota bacterium]